MWFNTSLKYFDSLGGFYFSMLGFLKPQYKCMFLTKFLVPSSDRKSECHLAYTYLKGPCHWNFLQNEGEGEVLEKLKLTKDAVNQNYLENFTWWFRGGRMGWYEESGLIALWNDITFRFRKLTYLTPIRKNSIFFVPEC